MHTLYPTTPREDSPSRKPGARQARACALAVAALLAGAAAGCRAGPVEPDPAALLQAPGGIAEALVVETHDARRWPADAYELVEASVDGDVLTLQVRYGGGCREHRFALVVTRLFMESHPVQVPARLSHDAGGDLCRALLQETLRFDLGPVKRAYQDTYGTGPDVISLVVDGAPIRYAF